MKKLKLLIQVRCLAIEPKECQYFQPFQFFHPDILKSERLYCSYWIHNFNMYRSRSSLNSFKFMKSQQYDTKIITFSLFYSIYRFTVQIYTPGHFSLGMQSRQFYKLLAFKKLYSCSIREMLCINLSVTASLARYVVVRSLLSERLGMEWAI